MKRLYLEFFVGLSGLFFLCVVAVSYVTEELTPDYEAEIEISYVASVMQILGDVAAQRGQEQAEQLFEGFVERSHLKAERYSWGHPTLTAIEAEQLFRHGAVFEDENQYWATFGNKQWIYYLEPDRTQTIWQYLDYEVGFLWLSFVATFALYSALMLKILARRFHMLEEATMAFSDGDFNVRASEKPGHRVGRLNERFNQMADKIAELIVSHKQLTNAIAHELRTPIFRVQCQLEMLEDTSLSTTQQGYVAGIMDDMEELEQLIDELLYYARMERSGITLAMKEQDVAEVLALTVNQCQKDTNKTLRLECPTDCTFTVDAHHLGRAVSNLVRNAFRYAEDTIIVRSYCRQGRLYIDVDDDGCGIPKDERQKILQPFYRIGTARDRQSGGHGLGLAIVSQVVSMHRGELRVGDSDTGGARFTIILPGACC